MNRSPAEIWFRKTVTRRDSDYEKRWNVATSCKLRNIFVNGSRRGLLDWIFRISIPESFSFSFFTKSLNFLRKRQSNRLDRRCLQWHRKSLSLQLVASVNSNFLNPRKATVGITVISSELLICFRFSKVWLVVSGKGRFWRHVKEVWTSLNFAKAHKNDSQL